jgi:hypothetical protein
MAAIPLKERLLSFGIDLFAASHHSLMLSKLDT